MKYYINTNPYYLCDAVDDNEYLFPIDNTPVPDETVTPEELLDNGLATELDFKQAAKNSNSVVILILVSFATILFAICLVSNSQMKVVEIERVYKSQITDLQSSIAKLEEENSELKLQIKELKLNPVPSPVNSEDAIYGADNCGTDWNEQAVKRAAEYLAVSSFSRDSLISQLEYDKFIHEQSVHGAGANGY